MASVTETRLSPTVVFWTAFHENGLMAHGLTKEEAKDKLATLGFPDYTFTHENGHWMAKREGEVAFGSTPRSAVQALETILQRTWYRGKIDRLLRVIMANAKAMCIITESHADWRLVCDFVKDVENGALTIKD